MFQTLFPTSANRQQHFDLLEHLLQWLGSEGNALSCSRCVHNKLEARTNPAVSPSPPIGPYFIAKWFCDQQTSIAIPSNWHLFYVSHHLFWTPLVIYTNLNSMISLCCQAESYCVSKCQLLMLFSNIMPYFIVQECLAKVVKIDHSSAFM